VNSLRSRLVRRYALLLGGAFAVAIVALAALAALVAARPVVPADGLARMLGVASACAALALVPAFAAARRIARVATDPLFAPLAEVTARLEGLAAGERVATSLPTQDSAEIRALVGAYNRAADLVQRALDERRAAEEQLKRFIADAGHELRTPLTVFGGFVDIIKRSNIDEAYRVEAFRMVALELNRMRTITERFVTLAKLDRPPAARIEIINVRDVVDEALRSVLLVRKGSVELAESDATLGQVAADRSDVFEAVSNLIDNALKYGAGTRVCVRIFEERGRVVVRVTNGGPGIPAQDVPHLFDRFYRGAASTETDGTGLGLAIARKAAERARGEVVFEGSDAGGTAFALRLPPYESDASDRLAADR